MAWIESHQELARHPKTRRAARALGISVPAMIGHLHLLWWWVLDFADRGDVTPFDAVDLADAAMWDGDAEAFVSALRDCGADGPGFLETRDGRTVIRDWWGYAGKLVERREADAERKRAGRHGDVRRTSAGHPQDVSETAYVTVPNHDRTVPNTTQPPIPKQESLPGGGKPTARARDGGAERAAGAEGTKPSTGGIDAPVVGATGARAAPKPNKVAEVVDGIRALGVEVVVTPADAAEVKRCPQPPGTIAEAYAAGAKGDWGADWLQASLSLQLVCRKIGGYLAQRDFPRARSPANGRAGDLSAADLRRMAFGEGGP